MLYSGVYGKALSAAVGVMVPLSFEGEWAS